MAATESAYEQFMADNIIDDPGASRSINCNKSPGLCHLVSATAESRTLPRPNRAGAILTVHMKTDGGDITLAVTGGYNETGDTSFVFSDVGQFAVFQSLQTAAGVYFWRLISHHGIGNLSADEAGLLNGLQSTLVELDAAADDSARVVPITPTASQTITLDTATYGNRTTYITTTTVSFNIAIPAFDGTTGRRRIIFGGTLSSATVTITATGAHLFGGVIQNTDASVTYAAALTAYQVAAGGATIITCEGVTKGGRKGDWIEIEDIATGYGQIRGSLNASGTEATPFS